MSEDQNIKKFVVTGAAAMELPSSAQTGGKAERKTRKQQRKQEGGTSPGTLVQLNTTRSPDSTMAQVKPVETIGLKATVAPVVQGGGQSKDVKVILAPKKKKTAKVILAIPKKKVLQSIAKAVASTSNKTRKVAKKIRMSISSLSNRMTRANKIRKESKELPIEKIKEILKNANLIKETTKAPEDILRQMYADYLLLKNRAL